ncbi:dynein heavy chain, outer arm [Phytophthora infestans T30-4]|uniref:Dynein heavy chain, cytoplasmic n=1 Tax=Phytophthora infestans (strain T30-4) TaxID=403677 RepID=D0NS52_PHYIT|nr:dynein heavy chain, outer arm [Phytophthora infestans T30-4]EEY63593.1 dynein heavy chain, outer arm [Phytophthora infestans T30-4]|eukprot:XP_002898180.1 dynein heavy chain, outer arm [Phytophthora infestans T30-4]
MAFQARHRWMIQRLQLGLGFEDESQVEELLRGNGIMEQLSRFFRADGPTKIFFYYQTKGAIESDSVTHSSSTAELQRRELFVTDGLDETLQGRAVFFAKVAPEASDDKETNRDDNPETLDDNSLYDSTPRLPLDPAVANDHLLTYGVLDSSVLLSIETHLAQLFVPMLTSREESEWGQAESDTRNDFMLGLKSFVTDVQENLKAMNTGLDLRKPDKRYDTSDSRSLSKLSSDDGAVQHFVELVKDWCKQTEAYLEDNDQGRWESHEAGPATELEYWKRRLQRLMGITEQLKTKECKMVTGVLNVVSKLQDGATDKLGIAQLLRQWKQIDTNITEASNEAKDNVKYLATLERFIEPLYTGTPTSVVDALPALMNSVKMIHTIARYYNTTERMTKLFMKITNQMIALCKNSLVGREPPEAIWDKDPEVLLVGLEACLKLNEAYQEQYRLTKDKLLTMPKGKQFDFSETQIFGKFDLFCRRLVKLIDMFSTIHQFRALAQHSLEGMDALLASFNTIIREFRAHKHNLLDFHNNKFDRDYVEFNIQIADLEASLQQFINVSFDSITSIEQSLQLLKQFQQILQRETLRSDLDSKFTVIFHNYGLDLSHVQELYERHRHDPPVARNLPPVAGNILWSRHLLRRIEEPMRKFESNPTVLSTKDSKKIIKTYNKVARTLVAFEYLWYEAWCRSVENARAGLHATLIIRHPDTGRLFVNFDKEILQLIREARCLDRMGIEVPENARMVMLQEDKFKAYYNDLSYALHEYDRVTAKIIPVTAVLLRPHLEDLQHKLRPGLVTLTWTSMNIDAYTAVAHAALQRLEELISSVLDAIENRIEKNLVIVSKASLVHLPTDQSFALDDFVRMQEKHVANVTKQLAAKNVEIENAVEDVLRLICEYNLDGSTSSSGLNGGISALSGLNTVTCDVEAMETFRSFYRNLFYRSLVTCTKQSLDAIKKRVCSKAGTGFLFLERPFFEVDVQLSVPSVRLSPSLDDIQKAINRSAVAVLRCSKSLYEWGQQSVFPESMRTSLFERLGCDTEIIKVAILLTGALHGTKNQVHEYLSAFKKYDWLWKEDMEFRYNQFMQRNPLIQDFETELRHFMAVEAEISLIAPVHNIAVLSLNTKNLKLQLRNECRQWKVQYSDKVHQQARTALFNLTDYIRTTTSKLNARVETLDTLRFVMGVLKEVRERESAIEMELNPIADMYDMLEHYLPGGYMDKEEMDQKSVLRGSWRKLVDYAEEVTDNLSEVQGGFKKQLIKDVKDFQADVAVFRSDYEANGPMVSGLVPAEAVERLKRFKDLLGIRERKLEVFSAGEELFGMRPTEYPEIVRTRKEMALLDQLYGLYMDVEKTMDEFRGISWAQVGANVERMNDCFAGYDQRCKKMPKNLCEWEAYGILRKVITEFLEMLPIVRELTRESIKPRHWEEIITACNGQRLPYDSESFKFQDVLDAKLLTWKEDVEYICESAQKQLQIEHKLRDLTDRWAGTTFEFSEWRQRSVPVLKGYGQIIEDLEEGQLQLQAILSMRHVVFFKDRVQVKLAQLSDTADVLELWAKVQTLWMSLESVFTGGDIAKQMPLEAKKFAKIDKDWLKVMSKAAEVGFVVSCCSNELLRSTLPSLFGELEKCQKSLEGYLEQKRKKFPRFYFVSNPLLLLILSRGSDPAAVQQYYEKIFDSISHVVHERPMSAAESKASSTTATNPIAKRKIVEIKSLVGNDEETISLVQPVLPDGNIEDWLGMLEKEMRRTLKTLCRQAAAECSSGSLREFVSKTCAQFALLGIQLSWTAECQDALQRCRTTKGIMAQTAKKHGTMLSELSSWCLTDLGTKLTRTKVETLITIQVHQRDCFLELCKLYKEKKLSDANDFEWLKQARFYWRVGGQGAFDSVGPDACLISICDVDFKYAFEYLGCKERLVITPLTDRAYITLSQALGMHLGGAPAGPAGTGKTETVKDLGRSLGVYVIVTNCTDQQRYSDMAKIFKGLCQGGLWGCFDEFNRIELPVLSVVAQQVLAITNAKRVQAPTFTFPGDPLPIGLHTDAAYFITMNPGYQGRQELPENLKALFRGVSMMVPDREIIMKVRLCAVGYDAFAELARKFKTLYAVCEGQLSKQRHYDFGLRNILSVLRSAGATKRDNLLASEELLMMTTLRDMNLSKLVAADVPIFLSLLRDIFPGVEPAPSSGGKSNEIAAAVEDVLHKSQSWPPPATWSAKVTQLYETQLVRHGIALVGPAGSGKSEILRTLQTALSNFTRTPHRQVRLNPKAVRAEELFGETDRLSGEWVDGVFAAIWAKFNDRSRKDVSWLVCDGPVDAVWIENLNTVLDDNKLLTLANGDRLPMTDNCKLLFEVEDLRNASPATVSRAGIVYVSDTDLDWEPVAQRWLRMRPDSQRAALTRSMRTLVGDVAGSGHLFEFLTRRCRPVMIVPRVALIQACLNLLQSLLERSELSENSQADLELELERLFAFALAWAVGGVLDLEDRNKLHHYLVEKAPATTFPSSIAPVATQEASVGQDSPVRASTASNSNQTLTVFDHFLHPSTLEWEKWTLDTCENLLTQSSGAVNVGRLIIPTTDTARSLHLLEHLNASHLPVLLVGEPGTGKSTLVRLFFENNSSSGEGVSRTLIFSGATLGGAFQATVEADLEKRGGKTFGPSNGQQLTLFLDDLSMPALNEWGDQPTLEVVRQLVETRTLCFLDKDKRGDIKVIEGLRFLAAMGLPGGGKNDAPARLKRHFFILNLLPPSPEVAEAIFAQLTRWKFIPEDNSISSVGIPKKSLSDLITRLSAASVQLWLWLRRAMPPTPQKFHYVFSLRELSRSFQGILRAPTETATTSEKTLIRLWQHESERVFGDRLVSTEDKQRFRDELNAVAEGLVTKSVNQPPVSSAAGKDKVSTPTPDGTQRQSVLSAVNMRHNAVYVDFLQDQPVDELGEPIGDMPRNYEPVSSLPLLRSRVEHLLSQFNRENPGRALPSLILFEEALFHLARLTRVLGLAQSNMMLVGVGGSGKQSLARLAAALSGHELCQLAVTKAYTLSAFLDDLRGLCKTAGQVGKGVVFLLTETDIKDDSFLEQVNALLATGEVPGLFPRDELVVMASELRGSMQRECPDRADTLQNLTRFFHDRVRRNLHVVLCLSPVSARFADRCREFPHLVNGCTIDWFLPWPEEALTAVSQGYLDKFVLETPPATKDALILQMGRMHQAVEKVSDEYFARRRRRVVQTPRSFLSFLSTYKELYAEKLSEVRHQEGAVNLGLQKLGQGARDVEKMKVVLKEEEAKLVVAEAAANKMLETLQVKSLEAKKENDIVQQIREQCLADAAVILAEKEAAEEDLKRAQPFLDEAERAASSIRPNDLNELKKLAKPGDIIKLIFDCVAILQMAPLLKVERAPVTLGVGKEKHTCDFVMDSFQLAKSGMLADTRFLQHIFYFSKHQKDQMNDETLEFMAPYMELSGFSAPVAKNASKAAEGLFCWVKAMSMYHEASKVVKPKLEALRIAEGKFEAAQARLQSSEEKLQKCQNVLTRLQDDFQTQMAEKARVEAFAQATKRKMDQATALIGGLGGEKVRWTGDSNRFVERKQHLVGDCALAAAFLCYCGPFNREYRDLLLRERIPAELGAIPTPNSATKPSFTIPLTRGLALEEFLADAGSVSDWKLQGLPSDPLSIQNGMLVARAPRFPLLIDPQGQALSWVLRREAERLPTMGVVSVSSPKLREILEHCVGEGKALVLDGVDGADPDPLMANVLDKNFIVRAKGKFVKIMDRVCEYNEDFALYLTTRVPNPHFSPELQARTLVVDFTVTQRGLEEQLLAQVIRQEQRSLEEQLERVQCELNANAKALIALDALLLERLSASKANLLDDVELVSVLANTKAKATEVNDKILAAEEVKRGIDEKREHYRPVAARGSVLYFGIVDFAAVNAMYQTSLDQFLQLFVRAIEEAERSSLASKRVTYIIETLTYIVFRYVNRGLYDRHRLSFLLMIALKVLVAADCVTPADVTLFLKAGASRKLSSDQPKPFNWMSTGAWLNAVQLASEKPHFRNLLGDLERSENIWRKWFEDNEPERLAVPDYEGLLFDPRAITSNLHFHRLLLVRSLREDRTIPAVLDFIRAIEFIEGPVGVSLSRVPALGPRYVEPITDTVESVYQEMRAETPVLYLLSPGADPTESIEQLARRKRQSVTTISMGEGQEVVAARTVASAMLNGSWVLLQNCHLGLNYMDTLCETLTTANSANAAVSPARAPEFRLFLTSEPHPDFPISLLHRSTKVTNEPPAGLRAGLLRSFTVLVDQDKLDRLETASWRSLLFAVCFLHAVVVERRKFGPLGFSVPYEFNAGDMGASLSFLERHLYTSPSPSWPTVQYMVAEVHYGGRITDELDRRLFRAYCDAWFNPTLLGSSFSFNPEVKLSTGGASSSGQLFNYCLPDSSTAEIEEYQRYIAGFPSVDSPEVFGLHPNADLTYRVKEVSALLGTIVDTQPTDAESTTTKSETREDVIQQKIRELLAALPTGGEESLSEEALAQSLRSKVLGGGLELPLNLFLCQEARALRMVLKNVRASLIKTQRALAGEVLLTSSLRETGQAIFDGKVPPSWVANEQAWLAGTLGLWITGLIDRVTQLRAWLDRGRPSSFWLAGFSNPQGFLTAVAQESTRAHASERWALDDVVYYSEVTDYERLEQIKQPPREGVLVHGLMLDGAAWNRPDGTLVEQEPKRLFASLPAVYVTAATKAHKKTRAAQDHGPYGAYEAPVYRYARRTDKHYIFSVSLASRDHRPLHWTLRGVALLCSTDQ